MEDDVDNLLLPDPALKLMSRDLNKKYCEVCLKCWDKKNAKRAKLMKVDTNNFKSTAKSWSLVDHAYNKIFARSGCADNAMYVCKSCRPKFFSKQKLEQQSSLTESTTEKELCVSSLSEQPASTSQRSSSRKRCTYKTDRHEEKKKQCIVCQTTQRNKKGKRYPVILITLQDVSTRSHIAEETLLKFSKIHVKHDTKYKNAGERILLIAGTKSLFLADVGYHKKCYSKFRATGWQRLENPSSKINSTQADALHLDSFENLCQLVHLHVLCRREIYSLTDLKAVYDKLRTEDCLKLRVGDIKSRLQEKFGSDIQFSSLEGPKSRSRLEYIAPAGESVTSEILTSVYHGGGMPNSALLRAAATRLHHQIRQTQYRRSWPPTPQDIYSDKHPFNATTYNLLAWIVSPRAPIGEDGLAKLYSERKSRKIQQMCRNLESLMPQGQPSMDQVLLSLVIHRKTGSRDIIDILHRYGHSISSAEMYFIENVWAEWDRKQNTSIPPNIKKHTETTVIADNIDSKNKSLMGTGRETHNTNVILVQHNNADSENSESKVSLQADYACVNKKNALFKSDGTDKLSEFHFKKCLPKKFMFENSVKTIRVEQHSVHASRKTIAWVLCRTSTNNKIPVQVPAWSGFQNVTGKKPVLCKINVGYLPAITDTPTKYEVVYEILQTTARIMQALDLGYIFLEVDQAIYHKILDVKFQMYHRNEFDRIIVRMGGFHIIICLMRSIHSRFRGFGFVDLLSSVGSLGGPGTIESAMKAGDVKTGIRLYKLLFEALCRIKIKTLEEASLTSESTTSSSLRVLINHVNADQHFKNIDLLIQHPATKMLLDNKGNGEMVFWIDSFLDMVQLLLNIIHFQRTGNWNGFMETIYKFLPYCFALNRNKYARNLSYYYLDMLNLEEKNPSAYKYLLKGGFTGSITGLPHSNIPMDQVIETTINRYSKSTGGIKGKTEDPDACEKWGRLSHYMCALKEHLDYKIGKKRSFQHAELGSKRMKRDESDVQKIVDTLTSWVPNLYTQSQPLINICNGRPASAELINNVKSTYSLGKTERDKFLSRLCTYKDQEVDAKLTYRDKIEKQKVLTFADKKKPSKVTSISVDEGQSFTDILARYDQKILDHEYLMSWPVTSRPWAICDEEEKSRSNPKHIFRNSLQKLSPEKPQKEIANIPIYIVDTMKVVRMISPCNLKPPTYETWVRSVYCYISNLPGDILHIVIDTYPAAPDLSQPTKVRYKTCGQRIYVSDLSQKLPLTQDAWSDYLSNEQNKHDLTNLMVKYILDGSYSFNRPVYVTHGEKCILVQDGSLNEVPGLRSKHKEADPRLALHAVYASSILPGKPVCVVSDDTDVFIILLSVVKHMNGTMFFRQGKSSSNSIEYHNVTSLAGFLGEDCCKILPAFHALTGSDFTYPFYRRSKYGSFVNMMNLKKLKSRPVTSSFLNSLGTLEPDFNKIIDFILHTIYNRPWKEKSPADSRYAMLFIGKRTEKNRKYRSTKLLPPDTSTLEMKIRRSNLISYGWNNCLNPDFISMLPITSGWVVKDNLLVPLWYEGDNLPTDEEYDQHIKQKYHNENTENTEGASSNTSLNESDSESDYDSDELPVSETYSSSSEDED